MSFPLYSVLLGKSSEEPLTAEEKAFVVDRITQMSDKNHENIFTIIRVYGLKHKDDNPQIFELPYGSQKIGSSIKFNLEELPFRLQRMIHEYTSIHSEQNLE